MHAHTYTYAAGAWGAMAWYQPRVLEAARLGGAHQPGELPKETEPIFCIVPAEEHAPSEPILRKTSTGLSHASAGLSHAPSGLSHTLAGFSHQEPFVTAVTGWERLTGDGAAKPVFAARLDVQALPEWDWMPGDAFGLLPENDPEVVAYAIRRLGLDAQQLVRLEPLAPGPRDSLADFFHALARPLTVDALFTQHLDLSYFPKKACLRQLAGCCSGDAEKTDLLFLSSRAGSAPYLQLAGERTTILDFLHTFATCAPPLELLLRHLPLLHPRFYSIANARLPGGPIEFVFNTIAYETPDGLPRRGICSSYLERALQHRLPIRLVPRPNATVFRAPADPAAPVIMICSGTGVSPFIGFLRHWEARGGSVNSWLFYGFRSMAHDYLFGAELAGYLEKGILGTLTVAVSRQPELGHPKYVQHAVEAESSRIYALMSQDARTKIYICGDELTMVKGVNEALAAMLAQQRGLPPKEATAACLEWAKQGRIVRDVWI